MPIVEGSVTVKCRAAIQVMLLYFNLWLSAMLDCTVYLISGNLKIQFHQERVVVV
jgi:hypothetical protein